MANIHFKTFGCSANHSDTEIMSALATKEHYLSEVSAADVIVLNVCTVKGDASALREIRIAEKNNPKKGIVIAGCVTPELKELVTRIIPRAVFLNTHTLTEINTAIRHSNAQELFDASNSLANHSRTQETLYLNKAALPKIQKNPAVAIIQCSSGCHSACTFCSTKLIKGQTQSYSISSITTEVSKAVQRGSREIWLTATDLGSYGFDVHKKELFTKNQNKKLAEYLPSLVQAVSKVRGPFMVRIGMANPLHIAKYTDELIHAMKHDKVFKFLHIPVQSGSDSVLRAMRRGHTAQTYRDIVAKFRTAIPQITIATDIIVGFPGESTKDFEETLELIRETKPDVCNIARFISRPGTIGSTLANPVHGNEAKKRSTKLSTLFKQVALEQRKKLIDWEGPVIIDDKTTKGIWIARTPSYGHVLLRGDFTLGNIIHVKITDCNNKTLMGEKIQEKEIG